MTVNPPIKCRAPWPARYCRFSAVFGLGLHPTMYRCTACGREVHV